MCEIGHLFALGKISAAHCISYPELPTGTDMPVCRTINPGMGPVRFICGTLILTAALEGQLRPIQIAAQCSTEAIQNLALPCTAESPCPLYLELAGVEQVASRIVLTGNVHTGTTTLESILLISDDAGQTWTEPFQRIPSAVLDQIQFLDFEAGWINGHLLQSAPKDPFFLLTSDGGKTWRKRPIAGESRTGAVEEFWFDSRSHGMLSIDRVRPAENGFRYELWESMTGGDSWSVRQVDSKPVAFSRPGREPTVRIDNDRSGKVHRIQRRAGDSWTPIASFLVSAGECKPPEVTEADRPPSPEKSVEPPSVPSVPATDPGKPPSLRKN